MKNSIISIVMLCLTAISMASEYATTLISAQGPFGGYPYDDPSAALGEPASWIYDDYTYFDSVACSMVYGAWNLSPQDEKVIVTLNSSGSNIVVGFDHKVLDDPANPYGIDLIVFGNSAFTAQNTVGPDSDMDTVQISSSALLVGGGKIKVEVAAEPNGLWFAFSRGPWADNLFPTQRFAWNSVNDAWGQPLDTLKPVNPNLKPSNFSNLTVSQAIALYKDSAGGTGLDLQWLEPADFQALPVDSQTGRRWIQYVRLSYEGSPGGQVDAVADVSPVNVPQFPPGDVNYDYRVDLNDLMILAQNWMVCTCNCD
jgi:hypothetical protein